MSEYELGHKLKFMYEEAKTDKVAMIHLFGIKYADEIIDNGYAPKRILEIAEMRESYLTEVYKGIKLAKYVEAKD